jgi:hypothetical protein
MPSSFSLTCLGPFPWSDSLLSAAYFFKAHTQARQQRLSVDDREKFMPAPSTADLEWWSSQCPDHEKSTEKEYWYR